MTQKVFYLCDGEKDDCKKRDCYKSGGRCKHTKDIRHAKNFHTRSLQADKEVFWEKETASEKADAVHEIKH